MIFIRSTRITFLTRFVLCLLNLWICSACVQAQASSAMLPIADICVEGNRRTRTKVIMRELTIRLGDSLSVQDRNRAEVLNTYRLQNLGIFSVVVVHIDSLMTIPTAWYVNIYVQENFYITPIPTVEFADRNFNVWWTEQNRDLSRINYGLDLTHANLTGHRDVLQAKLQNGYTQKVELDYLNAFMDKFDRLGLEGNVLLSRNREVHYATINDQQAFYHSDDEFLLYRRRYRMGVLWRPKLLSEHRLRVGYEVIKVNAFVPDSLNANYLLHAAHRQRMFRLAYRYRHDNRDQQPYPMSGHLWEFHLVKEGLGIFQERNALFSQVTLSRYWPLRGSRLSMACTFEGQVHLLRNQQAFYRNRAIGFDKHYVRGYEYYVVDGLDFAILSPSVRYQLLDRSFQWGKWMPVAGFRTMPTRIFLKLYSDLGYVNDPYYAAGNALPNSLLWGGGIGLDFVFYYNRVFHLEYSVNRLGDIGLYLHYIFDF